MTSDSRMYVISLVTLRGKRERARMGHAGGTAGGELVSTVELGPEMGDARSERDPRHMLQARQRVRVPTPGPILTAPTTNFDRRC